jgi:hypothetical protein
MLPKLDACSFFWVCIDWGGSMRIGWCEQVKWYLEASQRYQFSSWSRFTGIQIAHGNLAMIRNAQCKHRQHPTNGLREFSTLLNCNRLDSRACEELEPTDYWEAKDQGATNRNRRKTGKFWLPRRSLSAVSPRPDRVGAICVAATLGDMNTRLHKFSNILERSLKLGRRHSTIDSSPWHFQGAAEIDTHT